MANWSDQAVIKAILQFKGIFVDCLTARHNTPLHFAAQRGNLAMVKLLVDNGANFHLVNCQGAKPMNLAADTPTFNFLNEQMTPADNDTPRSFFNPY